MGNDGNLETVFVFPRYGQADAVYGNGTFFYDESHQFRRCFYGIPYGIVIFFDIGYGPGAVDVTGNDMTAEPAVCFHGSFQIDVTAGTKSSQGGTVQSFVHYIRCKLLFAEAGHCQAYAVDGDTVTEVNVFQHCFGSDGENSGGCSAVDGPDRSYFFDDACEHEITSLSMRISSPSIRMSGVPSAKHSAGSSTPAPPTGPGASWLPKIFGAM